MQGSCPVGAMGPLTAIAKEIAKIIGVRNEEMAIFWDRKR